MGEDSTGALTGRRLMTKEFQNYKWGQESPPAIWDESKNNWVFGGGAQGWVSSETYFDTSGYTRDDLTLFPERITVQESGSFRIAEDPGGSKVGAIVLDMITEERFDGSNASKFYDIAILMVQNEVAPGFNLGELEFDQIIYGRYRMLGHDSNIWTITQGNLTLLNETQFGSGSPTTADKLWCTRIVIPLGGFSVAPDTFIIIPSARYIMSATIAKESDLSYLMRQKRSYELA